MAARLNALVADDGGLPCYVRFQYGLTPALGINTPWLGDGVSFFRTGETASQEVGRLRGYTNYYFRAQIRNLIGTRDGAILSFQTGRGDYPTIETLAASAIGEYNATINGLLADDAGNICSVRFLYGPSMAYGYTTPYIEGLVSGNTYAAALMDLVPGIAYHFCAEVKVPEGSYRGADASFTTLSPVNAQFVGDDIIELISEG